MATSERMVVDMIDRLAPRPDNNEAAEMESNTHEDGGRTATNSAGVTDGRIAGLSIFSGQPQGHVSDMMSPPEMPAGLVLDFDPSVLAEGTTDDVLFRADRADGFSLTKIRLAPNYILPTHHHDVDCLYYVESGWILLGRRRIAAGGGFMVRAETPYGYRAGSAGATVLEFPCVYPLQHGRHGDKSGQVA